MKIEGIFTLFLSLVFVGWSSFYNFSHYKLIEYENQDNPPYHNLIIPFFKNTHGVISSSGAPKPILFNGMNQITTYNLIRSKLALKVFPTNPYLKFDFLRRKVFFNQSDLDSALELENMLVKFPLNDIIVPYLFLNYSDLNLWESYDDMANKKVSSSYKFSNELKALDHFYFITEHFCKKNHIEINSAERILKVKEVNSDFFINLRNEIVSLLFLKEKRIKNTACIKCKEDIIATEKKLLNSLSEFDLDGTLALILNSNDYLNYYRLRHKKYSNFQDFREVTSFNNVDEFNVLCDWLMALESMVCYWNKKRKNGKNIGALVDFEDYFKIILPRINSSKNYSNALKLVLHNRYKNRIERFTNRIRCGITSQDLLEHVIKYEIEHILDKGNKNEIDLGFLDIKQKERFYRKFREFDLSK